jgi:hypothetical protein
LQKVLAVGALKDLYTLSMSQVFYKERTKLPWSPTTGLLKLGSQDFQTIQIMLFLLTNREISLEKI